MTEFLKLIPYDCDKSTIVVCMTRCISRYLVSHLLLVVEYDGVVIRNFTLSGINVAHH